MHIVTDYLHALNGRLRVKVPEVKGSEAQARAVQGRLESLYGIKAVHANPLTGNVLIYYHPEQITQAEILRILCHDLGCFRQGPAPVSGAGRSPNGLAGTVARAFMESVLQSVVMALI